MNTAYSSMTAGDVGAVWWAWAATILVVLAIGYDVRRDVRRIVSARNVVLLSLFAWYLLEAIQAGPEVFAYGAGAYEWAVFAVVLAGVAFLIGYHRSRAQVFDAVSGHVAQLQDRHTLRRTLALGVLIGMVPLVVYGLSDPGSTLRALTSMRRHWGGPLGRGTLGDFRAAVLMLETFLFGVAWVALIVLADRRRTRGFTLLAAGVVGWNLVRSYGTGTRSMLFLSLVPVAALWYWRADAARRRVLLYAAIPCAAMFYWLAGVIAESRNEGRLNFSKPVSYVGAEMFRELLFIMDEVPRRHEYLYGETYLIELVNPIPRFLWAEKPMGFGVTYARWRGYDTLAGGPNLSPGILGEMYANFGLAGIVLVSLAGGVLCRAWDRMPARYPRSLPVLMLYSLGLGGLVLMGRSFSIQVHYQLLASLLCVVLVTRAGTSRAEDRRCPA